MDQYGKGTNNVQAKNAQNLDFEIKKIFQRPGFLNSIQENLKTIRQGVYKKKVDRKERKVNTGQSSETHGFVPFRQEQKQAKKTNCSCKNS